MARQFPMMDQAACRGLPIDTFYFDRDNDPNDWRTVRAKAICNTCPVIVECLGHAVITGEKHGIWGGTTPDERGLGRKSAGGALG